MERLVFDLTKIPFLKRLIGIHHLIVEVLNDQNLFTESNLANWFSSYVQFCSGGHFSERAEAARWCGKMNHLNATTIFLRLHHFLLDVFQKVCVGPIKSKLPYMTSAPFCDLLSQLN